MRQSKNIDEKEKQSIKELIKSENIPTKIVLNLTIIMILLMLGTLLAVFSSFITQSFADAYLFMSGLRSIFNTLLINMITYPVLQTPELISNLENITIFNLIFTNLLLFGTPPTLSVLIGFPQNVGIIDVIIGYTLTIYSTFNLIQLKIRASTLIFKTIYLQILYIICSLSGSVIIIGIMFYNIAIIAICALIIVLTLTYLALKIPIG